MSWESATDMKKQTDRRQMGSLSVRSFFVVVVYQCVAWTKLISPLQTAWEDGHAGMLIFNAAKPIVRHRGLLLTPSCRWIQHSCAGPPPGKQMAGNNTVTHPERWHPGPGLHQALCYLSARIASEIPPLSSQSHLQIRRYTWVKLTGQLSPISQTYASILQCVSLLEVFKWPRPARWGDVTLGLRYQHRWPVSQTSCECLISPSGKLVPGLKQLTN